MKMDLFPHQTKYPGSKLDDAVVKPFMASRAYFEKITLQRQRQCPLKALRVLVTCSLTTQSLQGWERRAGARALCLTDMARLAC